MGGTSNICLVPLASTSVRDSVYKMRLSFFQPAIPSGEVA